MPPGPQFQHSPGRGLRDGLAFEESELFQSLPRFRKSRDFRELAEMQAWPVPTGMHILMGMGSDGDNRGEMG